jgi:hypothetical protein
MLSQSISDERLNGRLFGATPHTMFDNAFTESANVQNRLALPQAINALITNKINLAENAKQPELKDFLPYPHVWEGGGGKKPLNLTKEQKEFLARQRYKLPLFVQSSLDQYDIGF